MAFERLGDIAVDYQYCQYGESNLRFRGPQKDLSKPYVAFLGSTELFGRYVQNPVAECVEALTGHTCVNMAQNNAGIDCFLYDETVLNVARSAELVVIQALPAHTMSNRFYKVHPRRNDRFLKPSILLETMFPSVDFSQIHFTRHLLLELHRASPSRFQMVRDEIQAAWSARMQLLMRRLPNRKLLLNMTDKTHRERDALLGPEPLFVTQDMVEMFASQFVSCVNYEASKCRAANPLCGMVFPHMEEAVAEALLPQPCHDEAAAILARTLEPHL